MKFESYSSHLWCFVAIVVGWVYTVKKWEETLLSVNSVSVAEVLYIYIKICPPAKLILEKTKTRDSFLPNVHSKTILQIQL